MNRRIFLMAVLGIACAIAPVRAEAQYYETTNVAKGRPVLNPTGTYLGGPPSIVTDGKGDLANYWFSFYTQEFTIDLAQLPRFFESGPLLSST